MRFDAGRQTTEVRGESASYREAGSGLAVIVTAGLGLTSRFYEESYAAFADAGLRFIVPDLPGWGDTPGPRTGLHPADTASFLIDFARSLGVGRAVWIGHSLGAQAVARVAEDRPDLAAGLVLVGPTGGSGRWNLLRQAWGLAIEAGRTSPAVLAAVAREYVHTPPYRYIGTWIRHGSDDLAHRLPRVQCPALILAGDADPICPPNFIELLRHRLPRARVDWVRGGTHALPRGHAVEFNRRIVEFVRQHIAP
jgi:pimeloyl-ACP methyl ester carboxylesterase